MRNKDISTEISNIFNLCSKHHYANISGDKSKIKELLKNGLLIDSYFGLNMEFVENIFNDFYLVFVYQYNQIPKKEFFHLLFVINETLSYQNQQKTINTKKTFFVEETI